LLTKPKRLSGDILDDCCELNGSYVLHADVRFAPESDRKADIELGPLCAMNRHRYFAVVPLAVYLLGPKEFVTGTKLMT
jgi:hypothetical protein